MHYGGSWPQSDSHVLASQLAVWKAVENITSPALMNESRQKHMLYHSGELLRLRRCNQLGSRPLHPRGHERHIRAPLHGFNHRLKRLQFRRQTKKRKDLTQFLWWQQFVWTIYYQPSAIRRLLWVRNYFRSSRRFSLVRLCCEWSHWLLCVWRRSSNRKHNVGSPRRKCLHAFSNVTASCLFVFLGNKSFTRVLAKEVSFAAKWSFWR